MDRQEMMKRLEVIEEEARKIREELEEPESVVWKPKDNDTCFLIGVTGGIYKNYDDFEFNGRVYAMGNCYRTEQEATDARDAKIILTDLQRMADEANGARMRYLDWNGLSPFILFVGNGYTIEIMDIADYPTINTTACFKTRESAEKALATLVEKYTEERVKMALSGVWR